VKLLFVLDNFYPNVGGAETLFFNLTRQLASQHQVVVITSRPKDSLQEEIVDGVRVIRVNTPKMGRRYWFTVLALPSILKAIGGVKIVHTTTYNAALPAWVAAKLTGRQIGITVLEVHNKKWFLLGEGNKLLSVLFYVFEWIILSLPFDRYICISESTKKSLVSAFSRINLEKTRVSYPAIDTQKWNANRYKQKQVIRGVRLKYKITNEFSYMYFGRPGISKGIEYLIEAVPLISRAVPNSKLVLVLSKEPYDRYQHIINLIRQLGVESKVVLVNSFSRDDRQLQELVAAVDCVVVPSLSEGFGYSAVEAALLRTPIVATRVGSLPEVVPVGTPLVEPGNSVSLASAVIEISRNKPGLKLGLDFLKSENYGNWEKSYVFNSE
jgi:glycosyltransferase involved in cell wall biosynthesis